MQDNIFEDQTNEDLTLLHEIYPNLNREQLFEAKENLDRYFDLAVKIFLRLETEEQAKEEKKIQDGDLIR